MFVSSPEEPPRLPDQLAIGVDLAVLAQVADHVPVQRRLVGAAELLERGTERDVHRPADLLVEERVAGEAVDLVVEPERNLAEPARTVVEVEHRVEERRALASLGLHDPALLEAKPDAV